MNEHLNSYKQYLNAVDRSNAITTATTTTTTTVAEINYIIDDRGELQDEQEGGEENKSIAVAEDNTKSPQTQLQKIQQEQQQQENEQARQQQQQQLIDEHLLDSLLTANIRLINQSTLIETCNQLNELNK